MMAVEKSFFKIQKNVFWQSTQMTHQIIISIIAAFRSLKNKKKKRQRKKDPNVSLEVSKKNMLKFGESVQSQGRLTMRISFRIVSSISSSRGRKSYL